MDTPSTTLPLSRSARILASLLVILVLSVGSFVAVFAQSQSDTEAPSYVDNVKAFPGDGEVRLTWDAASDNVGVTGYKIYMGLNSVQKPGDKYDLGSVEASNVLEHTVENLKNDTAYYFAMTALDAAGNESLSYSFEASATPTASDVPDDGNNPVVSSAEALDCMQVEVTFSEPVVFPEKNPEQAFTIEDIDTLKYLSVKDVSYGGTGQATLTLETDAMTEGAQYLLTVGSAIEDFSGNAMVSGTSDTAVFKGLACEPAEEPGEEPEEPTDEEELSEEEPSEEEPAEEADTAAPELEKVEAMNATTLELSFNEEVVLPEDEDPEDDVNPVLESFEIATETGEHVEITTVDFKSTGNTDGQGQTVFDHKTLVLSTKEHKGEATYRLTVTGLKDTSGNATLGDEASSFEYTTPQFEIPDTIPPEDVTNLVAQVMDMLVNLNWTASLNSAGDLVDQMFYVSSDGGTSYDSGKSLGKDAAKSEFSGGVEGTTYVFKVTTKDDNGNESIGTIVTATLPTTGAGIGLLAIVSLIGGGFVRRRRDNS